MSLLRLLRRPLLRLLLPLALLSSLACSTQAPSPGSEPAAASGSQQGGTSQPGPSAGEGLAAPVADDPHAGLDPDDSAACADCHEAVVRDHAQSLHAHATAEGDPIFAAVQQLRATREGDLDAACAVCHDPRAATGGHAVSCGACHPTPGTTPAGPGRSAADRSLACRSCHHTMDNPAGVSICATGIEFDQLTASDQACPDCHMPEEDGIASHRFRGPQMLWSEDPETQAAGRAFLASGLSLSPYLDETGLTLTVHNTAGHAFPSGFPGRMVLLRLEGLDESGAVVWRNFTDAPLQQDPQSVWNKVYHDADGAPTLAAWADSLARDTRLTPGESRPLSWSGLPAEVAQVEITLLFRLLPPPLAERLELADSPLAEARPFLTRTVAR